MFSTPLKSRVDYNNNNTFVASKALSNTNNQAGNATNGAQPLNRNNFAAGVNGNGLVNPEVRNTDGLNPLGGAFVNGSSALGTSPYMQSGLSGNNENIRMTGLGSKKPLEMASEYIDGLERLDANTPILDERSYYNNGLNYNFSKEVGGLGAFTPFERETVVNIPDVLLQEASKTEIKSDMGIFPELNRCWITIDNNLILWDIDSNNDFQSIEEIKHTILNVKLVKPKPNTFVNQVNYLLLISTPFDIYILALSYNEQTNDITVYNTGLSVSINGMGPLQIVSCEKTGQIFFASTTNGLNIWELQYTGSDDWFNSKCNKVCLTQSSWSSLLPTNVLNKLPGSELVQSLFEEDTSYSQETIIQLTIDQSRNVIYSLSSKSIIRAYLIKGKSLEGPMTIEPAYISRILGTTTARAAAILGKKYLKICKIISVSQQENNNLFLVALTIGGVRLYFNGSVGRNSIEALRLESVKFPPSSVTPEAMQQEIQQQQMDQQKRNIPFYSSMAYSESVLLKLQKKSAVLLETTEASTIISPGIFFTSLIKTTQPQTKANDHAQGQTLDTKTPTASNVPQTPAQRLKATIQAKRAGNTNNTATPPAHVTHRLFVSVPDYGILKKHGKYVENSTFLDTTSPVKEIIALSPSFNATTKPLGYANEFATQYSSADLRVAVLTKTSIEIYRYRTPDEVFESLIDNPLPFVVNYGLREACSSALYVTCKLNKSDIVRSKALTFLTVGLPGVVDIKPSYNTYPVSAVSSLLNRPSLLNPTQKSMIPNGASNANLNLDNVILSPRFYGIGLLIARLFRDIWDKQIFSSDPNAKFNSTGAVEADSLQFGNFINSVSISKMDIEYYLSSILILNEFFTNYGDSITQVIAPSLPTETSKNKYDEVANQAENIAVNSMIKLVNSMKEALSFLNVLYEESEVEGYEHQYIAFKDIIKFLKLDTQVKLCKLTFKDLFAPNDNSKSLIRDILLSVINRNISKGTSIELAATTLQERCGSFCSSSDILSFRATEHVKKAKEIGIRDYDSVCFHLNSAMKLYEKIVEDLPYEMLESSVNSMLELNYYPKTIEFLLNIANLMDKNKMAYQYVASGKMENDPKKIYYEKRLRIYDFVFDILVKVDQFASRGLNKTNESLLVSSDVRSLKDESYAIAFGYNDKLFHYHMYDWLVAQDQADKLLELDTAFIQSYLEENAASSLKISNLYWVYQSRKGQFYKAAEILYSLAVSDFSITLSDRIECLSRANGFCNGVCPPNQKQNMVQLAGAIQELFEIAGVQDDLLSLISTDNRIASETRQSLTKELDNKIRPVSDLFNDYAIPLGYHEVALQIFKVSDYRNEEAIMNEWNELFTSLKREFNKSGKVEDSMNFINLLSNVVTKVGRTTHTSEHVFPIGELFTIIEQLFKEILPGDHVKEGTIASIFISSYVPYSKLYYILKDILETSDSKNEVLCGEMKWLITEWYQHDRKLRDVVTFDDISKLDVYSIETDPIEKYTKRTGNSI
ncbi:Nup170 protein [Maudiozyma humilis]|uniref:Nup170 protein n=1 Tax=Maudiozyma humilis TaxID=51915 RepID=A0AAV5RZ67_MAUHU|nr:Nup170 protein [Kazachstania humilis]